MRLPVWAWLALSSLAAASFATAAIAATRPHYGGSMTVELYAAWIPIDSATSALSIPIAETLVRFNPRGGVDPVLCVAWQHDPDFKRWRFSLRPKVTFHDGEPLTGATAAPSLAGGAEERVFRCVHPNAAARRSSSNPSVAMPDLLDPTWPRRTARFSAKATSIHSSEPGRSASRAWEPGRRLVLAARSKITGTGGRIWIPWPSNLAPAHTRAQTYSIFPSGRPAAYFRMASRHGRQRHVRWWPSQRPTCRPRYCRRWRSVIDRAPIVNVLAQRKGEAAFSLLPQWLTGYAFLFQSTPDLARAKQLTSQCGRHQ